MSREPQNSSLFTHIDVSPHASAGASPTSNSDTNALLHQLVLGQQRQNELLDELVQQMSAAQKQRTNELGQWKEANPRLARQCRQAAEALSNVQTEFLRNLTEEITDNADCFLEGDFMLNEFVDRFGPRLAHLNGVLQVLSQLSSMPTPSSTS